MFSVRPKTNIKNQFSRTNCFVIQCGQCFIADETIIFLWGVLFVLFCFFG